MSNYRGSDIVFKRATVDIGAVVKNITDIGSPSCEFVDVSVLGDAWKSFLPVLSKEPGMIEVELVYDPANATIKAILDDFVNNESATYSVTLGADEQSFTAYVAEVGRPAGKAEHLTIKTKLRISGTPDLTIA